MHLPRTRAVLWTGLLVPACAGAAPNPNSVEDCNERTVRAFWESLEGDTILVRSHLGINPRVACHDGETAASCEARARKKLVHAPSPERAVYSCTTQPGASCWTVRHDGDVSTLHYPEGDGWDALGEALWSRWGHDEIDALASSSGEGRTASASAPIEGDTPRFVILLRHPSRTQAWAKIKEVARGWPALRVSMPSSGDSAHWQSVSVSCTPKNEPHPSTHEGPWHCFTGPDGPREVVADECFTSEKSCAVGREHSMRELRIRRLRYEETRQCSATPRVYCYEMASSYTNLGSWQSRRSFFCYPTRERCERFRPEVLLHASVESECFEAGASAD